MSNIPSTAAVIHRPFQLRDCRCRRRRDVTEPRCLQLLLTLLTVFCCCCCLLPTATCFNVDLRTASLREGDPGSMFGFVVAQHVDHGQNWIIVGAPNAQTNQPNVINAGAVYRCRVDSSTCQYIPFDSQGDNREWNGVEMVQVENKTRQWFGASLDASTTTPGIVVACAPRYVYFSRSQTEPRRDPLGFCVVSRSQPDAAPTYTRFSPCKKGAPGFGRLGHCQYGFSVALNDENTYMAAGAVGSYFWQGQVIAQDLSDEREFYETSEGPSVMDNTFMGYAITVGHFNNDSAQDYAVGIPKASNLRGMVVFLSDQMAPLGNISGEQTGEYFGSALATADFNGDELDDIAVGAPLFSHSSTEGFDSGRVYVFYQTKNREFNPKPTILAGNNRKSQARFGFAVASLGDINVDGYHDLVVGSPYDGPSGRGAVYIYHGSADGIRTTASQVCLAGEIDTKLAAFGYSVSGGTDLDKNGYPDIVIGAYASDQAVYLRSKPIIRVSTRLRVIPEYIDLENPDCRLRDRSDATCFSVFCCMSFTGLNVPNDIELNVTWRLDSTKEHSHRAFFFVGSTQNEFTRNETMRLNSRRERCLNATAYVKNNVRDKIRPITVQLNYTLVKPKAKPGSNDLEPVLDQYTPTTVTAQGHVQKRCGKNRFCIPDLAVTARSLTQEYTLGNTTEVDLQVNVLNRGEDAFEATIRIYIPSDVDYINIVNVYSKNSIDCVQPDNETDGNIVCDIGNPLPANHRVIFTVRTSAAKAMGLSPSLEFTVTANSSNQENATTLGDNQASVSIPVKAVVSTVISGVSHPENVLANASWVSSFEEEKDIGPEVIHLYEITNFGPSHVASMQTLIYWPQTLPDGSYLLYLLEIPRIIRGEGKCFAETANVNPLNVTLEKKPVDETVLTELARSARERSRTTRQTAEQIVGQISCVKDMPGCAVIRCETGSMEGKDDSILIQIRSRLYTNTLLMKQSKMSGVRAKSRAVTSVLSLPYNNVRREINSVDTHEVETFVALVGAGPARRFVDLWIILLAVLGGCLLLCLLVLLLWKVGFFKRKTVEEHPPLYQAIRTQDQ